MSKGQDKKPHYKKKKSPKEQSSDQNEVKSSIKNKHTKNQKIKQGSFEALGLLPQIQKSIKRKGFQVPTPIQRKTIPLILQKFDLVAMARTGSGKTAAFVIPMLQRLNQQSQNIGARAIIINPTRELALQTLQIVNELGRFMSYKTAVLVGGDSIEAQYEELATNPDILIVTPGRLLHHLQEIQGFNLQNIEYVVMDEADRLFEFGLMDQTNLILQKCSQNRQTMLFSATLPGKVAEFAKAGLKEPQVIRLDVEYKLPPTLSMTFFTVNQDQKIAALLFLLDKVLPDDQSTLIFTSTKHMVELLHTIIELQGIPCSYIYGDMDQTARVLNQKAFSYKQTRVLVVTDVAARGIDIPILDNVVNFDFTSRPKNYVHRVGRAARAGRYGQAYSLLTQDEIPYLIDLSLFLNRVLQPIKMGQQNFYNNIEVQNSFNSKKEEQHTKGGANLVFDAVIRDPDEPLYYGKIPASILDNELEKISYILNNNEDAIKYLKSTQNAEMLYIKTRPSAALESVRRSKILLKEGSHPLVLKAFYGNSSSIRAETQKQELLDSLKKFRPESKVFEDPMGRARQLSLNIKNVKSEENNQKQIDTQQSKLQDQMQQQQQQIQLDEQLLEHTQNQQLLSEFNCALKGSSLQATQLTPKDLQLKQQGMVFQDQNAAVHTHADTIYKGQSHTDNLKVRQDEELKEKLKKRVIKAIKYGQPLDNSKRYRDSTFFIPETKQSSNDYAEDGLLVNQGQHDIFGKNSVQALQAATMELDADDSSGLQKQNKRFHWDARKRRYVQLQNDEGLNRAGKRVKTNNDTGFTTKTYDFNGKRKSKLEVGQHYEKWKNRNKKGKDIGGFYDSEREQHRSLDLNKKIKSRFRKGGRMWKSMVYQNGTQNANKGTRSEITDKEKIWKQRQQKKQKQDLMQQRKHENKSKAKQKGKANKK